MKYSSTIQKIFIFAIRMFDKFKLAIEYDSYFTNSNKNHKYRLRRMLSHLSKCIIMQQNTLVPFAMKHIHNELSYNLVNIITTGTIRHLIIFSVLLKLRNTKIFILDLFQPCLGVIPIS